MWSTFMHRCDEYTPSIVDTCGDMRWGSNFCVNVITGRGSQTWGYNEETLPACLRFVCHACTLYPLASLLCVCARSWELYIRSGACTIFVSDGT